MRMIFVLLLITLNAMATCLPGKDLLVVGDSQIGATWASSYVGNFLQQCLKGDFVIYGRGATVPGNWIDQGGMDQIETIQRDPFNKHLNLGSKEQVAACKKRLEQMLAAHTPKKILLSFGGNYIGKTIDFEKIQKEIIRMLQIIQGHGITYQQCLFVSPTFEMEVANQRNIPHRDLSAVLKVTDFIRPILKDKCQLLEGVKLMQDSVLLNEKKILKRLSIPGTTGCAGSAVNDNVHICGEAAQELAHKLCDLVNPL
jgi:hypothetical protein